MKYDERKETPNKKIVQFTTHPSPHTSKFSINVSINFDIIQITSKIYSKTTHQNDKNYPYCNRQFSNIL